ncbi:MAG: tetratricopeptide repeat-containing protein, partial [Bacteroidota bacterium]
PWQPNYIVPEEVEIDLDNLLNNIKMGLKEFYRYIDDLNAISTAAEETFKKDITAEIIEKQALVYYELGLYEEAEGKYKTLRDMESADFSFASMEKYCNTRAKMHVKNVYLTGKNISKEAKVTAHHEIKGVIRDLQFLSLAGQTAERLNLMASTHKRMSMVAATKAERIKQYKLSLSYYQQAMQRMIKDQQKNGANVNLSYPLTNAVELSYILQANGHHGSGVVEKHAYEIYDKNTAIRKLGRELNKLDEQKSDDNLNHMDYWNMQKILNIQLCLGVVKNNKNSNAHWRDVVKEARRLWGKAGSPGNKLAELEHLKFLIFGLKTAVRSSGEPYLPYKDVMTLDDLNEHLDELKKALANTRKK